MKPDFVALYYDKFLVGISKMSADEIAAYFVTCLLIYSNGGPIPRDDIDLARRIKSRPSHVKKVIDKLVADSKLTLTRTQLGTNLDQTRCEHELNAALSRRDRATNAANERWKSKDLGEPRALRTSKASRQSIRLDKTRESPSLNSQTPSRARAPDTAARPPSPARRNGALSGAPPPPVAVATEAVEGKRFRIPSHFEGCQCPSCSEAAQ